MSGSPDAAVAAAAAAAAKIAAQYAPPSSSKPAAASPADGRPNPHDSPFSHDIEINDQRNRYMLTKGETQQRIHSETGAVVTTKGTWYPDKNLATPQDPPLYLHITANEQAVLDKAVEMVQELMKQDVPQLTEDRHAKRLEWEAQRRAMPERKKWAEEKVPIGLDPLRNFNVRAKVVGPGGLFVKYIQGETQTRVQIKGFGSGFIETETGREAEEPMHIHITGPDEAQLKEAKELAEDLMDAVRTEYEKARQVLMQQWGAAPGAGVPGAPMGPAAGGYGQQGFGGPQGGAGGFGGYQSPAAGAQQGGGWTPTGSNAMAPATGGGYGARGGQQGYQPPPPDGEQPPPPPPEDDAPPPPSEPAPSSASRIPMGPKAEHHQQQASAPAAAAAKPAKTPEEEALDKYWKDYITWEKSFVAYHSRKPTVAEGLQDVPAAYR